MPSISSSAMQSYLSASFRVPKLNRILVRNYFRAYLQTLGAQNQFTPSGWATLAKWARHLQFQLTLFFPEAIDPTQSYPPNRNLPDPDSGLHTICSTFHHIGIRSYFCAPVVDTADDPRSVRWFSVQLGLPTKQSYVSFPETMAGLNQRGRRYNFLRNNTDVSSVPPSSIPEEFSKEHLRVTFQNQFMSEIADVDGILWGNHCTYPVEIIEKTPATDNKLGTFFGLDIGPFVKLAFYATKQGNFHSIFVVREIDSPSTRNLVKWWFITFEQLAQFASWNPLGGGTNMMGGGSTVVKIPKAEFKPLDSINLQAL